MISEQTLRLMPDYPIRRTSVINNSFPSRDFVLIETDSEKLQFVWFSQNISAGRGLELFVPALYQLKDKVHLTLIGNLYQEFYSEFLAQYQEVLTIKPPMPESELNRHLCEYDIGLAVELSNVDVNKKLALSNKIFAYAQAGLFVLATDTPAQKRFINQHRLLGKVTGQTPERVLAALREIINQKEKIREQKPMRFEYAQEHLSWENETEKLTQIWQDITGLRESD
jgi:glycosyltransferase involved in cell wall biosynthesis